MKIIIVTLKSWNIENANIFKSEYENQHSILIISNKDEFVKEKVDLFNPDYIFFPHWSYIIPDEIISNYTCVIFHMADLPYGRGGSPLQNLIVRGHKTTMISALKATKELDAGPIYMKTELGLEGSAQEIFIRCSNVIFNKMIPEIINNRPIPIEQRGKSVIFKRRKREDGRLTHLMSIDTIYDFIRMLDAEGYPRAYIEFGRYVIEFENASMNDDSSKEIEAKVRIKEMSER